MEVELIGSKDRSVFNRYLNTALESINNKAIENSITLQYSTSTGQDGHGLYVYYSCLISFKTKKTS